MVRSAAVAAVAAGMLVSGIAGAAAETAPLPTSQAITVPTVADLAARTAANAPVAMPGQVAANGELAVTEHIAAGTGNIAVPVGSAMPPVVGGGLVADANR